MTAGQGTTVQTDIGTADFAKPALVQMRGHEELSQLFQFDVWFSSDDKFVDLESTLGHTLSVHCFVEDGQRERFFHGHIVEMGHEGWDDTGRAIFHATLKPWLWFLSQSINCRIFQEKSVADIIKDIFKQHGFNDYELFLVDVDGTHLRHVAGGPDFDGWPRMKESSSDP